MKFVTFSIILLVTAFIEISGQGCRNDQKDLKSTIYFKLNSAFCRFKNLFKHSECGIADDDTQEQVLNSTPDNTEYTTDNTLQPTTQTDEHSERVVTEEELLSDDFRCNPGQSFKLDCNRCWCAKNGRQSKSCTRMSCGSATYDPFDE